MKATRFLLAALLMLSLSASKVLSQEKHEHPMGEQEHFGSVTFPTSCSADAQKQFERGVAMLHSFHYEGAGKAFADIAATDPNCAMAYWGIAMSLYHQYWFPPDSASRSKAWAAIQKAKSVGVKTERENDWIAAIETYYKDSDKLDHRTRAHAYLNAMEKLHEKYPDDPEASAFYGLALISNASPTDKSYANQKKAAAILEKVFTENPNHPGASHYIIHSFDYPALASLALPAARNYAKIAPAAPHALHMPSHIFTRLGLWQESIQSNRASAAAAKKFAMETHMAGAWDQQLHAMDYLMYGYLQGAQDVEAKKVLDELNAVEKVEPIGPAAGYAFAAIPARYAIERSQWSEAASLTLRPTTFAWDRFRFGEAIISFARALGYTHTGALPNARKEIEKLEAVRDELAKMKEGYNWADQAEILRRGAAAWLAHAEGKDGEAATLARSAAELEDATEKHPVTPGSVLPAHELFGDLLLELKKPEEALRQYEASLVASPNRYRSLNGAAQAAKLMGDKAMARSYYEKLLTLCQRADADRAGLQEAKEFLATK